jgi:acyl phosphate:glycerol-3-phosphate acyltransferase
LPAPRLMTTALIAAIGYLLGSVPFGYLLVRIFRGEDVRQSGSGNIGATNVSRKSPALGVITLLLDALKGSAAVVVALALSRQELLRWSYANVPWYPDHPWTTPLSPIVETRVAIAALFAILGHMFPVWLKFRGGKGVATGLGSFLLIAPKAVLLAASVFVLVVLITRYISLGSILAVALFPVFALTMHECGDLSTAAFLAVASLLIIARHHENIRRLLAHTESRFQWSRQ